MIDLSEDSSLAGSVEDLEDKGKEGETTAEEDDIMEVDERPEDVAGNLGREKKGLKTVTRLKEEGAWYTEYLAMKKSMRPRRHLQVLPSKDR